MPEQRRVLVTGATGFVGANLARRLLTDGHEVHVLCRPGGDNWRLRDVAEQVRVHPGSVDDADAVEQAMGAGAPRWVMHCAAHGAYASQRSTPVMVTTNLLGTATLLDAAQRHGVEAFVHAGSSSEYGIKDHAPAETESIAPASDYAVTKAAATLLCAHRARAADRHIVTLRLYSVYGAWEDPSRLIPRLLVEGLHDRLPPLVDPRVARDFVHVDDVCTAFVLAATATHVARGSVFNIASGVQRTVGDAVEATRRLCGVDAEPRWGSMPDRAWDTTTWVGDGSAARSELGWTPATGFDDGLASTAAWLQNAPGRLDAYRQRQSSPP